MQNSKFHHSSVLYDQSQNESLGEGWVRTGTLGKQKLSL